MSAMAIYRQLTGVVSNVVAAVLAHAYSPAVQTGFLAIDK
jgi:hypothetical protein